MPPPRDINALDRKNTLKQVNSCTAGHIPCFVLGLRSFRRSHRNEGLFFVVRTEGSLCQSIPQDCSCQESQGARCRSRRGWLRGAAGRAALSPRTIPIHCYGCECWRTQRKPQFILNTVVKHHENSASKP